MSQGGWVEKFVSTTSSIKQPWRNWRHYPFISEMKDSSALLLGEEGQLMDQSAESSKEQRTSNNQHSGTSSLATIHWVPALFEAKGTRVMFSADSWQTGGSGCVPRIPCRFSHISDVFFQGFLSILTGVRVGMVIKWQPSGGLGHTAESLKIVFKDY